MSFNVKVDSLGDEPWERRADQVASVVRVHRPDVVGLQEPLPHQVADLGELLPEYEWVGEGRQPDSGGAHVAPDSGSEHTPVGVRVGDRPIEVVRDETFWLSESGERGSVGWDAAFPRIATLAEVETPAGAVVVCNTHLDHEGERARERGASLVRDRAERAAGSGPLVVTGDLNCPPGGIPYDQLTAGRLRDAAEEVFHHGPGGTVHGFDGDATDRIDYVLAAGAGVETHAVLADRWDSGYPSDHFPVVADLRID
jgi:endonuclease/exonuclease/phosphatase family metal-dependent hydrolase